MSPTSDADPSHCEEERSEDPLVRTAEQHLGRGTSGRQRSGTVRRRGRVIRSSQHPAAADEPERVRVRSIAEEPPPSVDGTSGSPAG